MSAQDREYLERFRIRPRPPPLTGRSGRAFITRVIAEMSEVGRGLGPASSHGNHAMSRGQPVAGLLATGCSRSRAGFASRIETLGAE